MEKSAAVWRLLGPQTAYARFFRRPVLQKCGKTHNIVRKKVIIRELWFREAPNFIKFGPSREKYAFYVHFRPFTRTGKNLMKSCVIYSLTLTRSPDLRMLVRFLPFFTA